MIPYDDRPCALGEGAFWHPLRGQFFWFDILAGRLLSRQGDEPREWRIGCMASAAGWVDRDRLMIGTEAGLALLDLRSGGLAPVAQIGDGTTRSNDGRADRQGGFWISAMGRGAEAGAGAIWRWHRGELRQIAAGITIPNAICFSPDGRLAHYADTARALVWRQPLDAEGWPEGPAQPFLDLAPLGLDPDGAVIDSSGALCVACWGAGCVVRFAPGGRRLDTIAVGGRQASCPAFGGADMRDLLVTTALQDLAAPEPGDGLPWLVRAAVPGLAEPQVLM